MTKRVLCLLALSIYNDSCAQEKETMAWESLFHIYVSGHGTRTNQIAGLGYDKTNTYISRGGECSTYTTAYVSEMQGEWTEMIQTCSNSKDVIYTTENTTFFLELKSKLVYSYGFYEIRFNDKKGTEEFGNDSIKVMFMSKASVHNGGLSKHMVIITRALESDRTKTTANPRPELSNASFHAVIIGIDSYADTSSFRKLSFAAHDARNLASLLNSEFGFEKKNIVLLENTATRKQILDSIHKKSAVLTENDNLLIFYAGHGTRIEDETYWLPSDAESDSRATFVSASNVISEIAGSNTGHILLMVDACYGGSMLLHQKAEMLNEQNKLPVKETYSKCGRQCIASVGLQNTADNSSYFAGMMKVLENKLLDYIPATMLYATVFEDQKARGLPTPIYGVLKVHNNNGGNFVFIRK